MTLSITAARSKGVATLPNDGRQAPAGTAVVATATAENRKKEGKDMQRVCNGGGVRAYPAPSGSWKGESALVAGIGKAVKGTTKGLVLGAGVQPR